MHKYVHIHIRLNWYSIKKKREEEENVSQAQAHESCKFCLRLLLLHAGEQSTAKIQSIFGRLFSH